MMTKANIVSIDSAPAPQDARNVSALLKSCGDPLRLQVLSVLSKNAFAALELSTIFEIRQNAMSHHLKILAGAGLVTTRREGNTLFYRRNDAALPAPLAQLKDSIFYTADQIQVDTEVSENLNALFAKRAKAAEQFFAENAKAFKQQQDLIAEFSVYGPEVAKLIDEKLAGDKHHALEIGPGAGEFLPVLAARFARVSAIELSQSMLEQSRQLCHAANIDTVDFVLGDTSECRRLAGTVDAGVLNMVLHHTAVPSQIFDDVAVAIKTGGTLIICDLCEHQQSWVQDACGDQWLGFSSQDLKHWAESSGFGCGADRYFALRNGFQIQIHQFTKQ